MEILAPAGSPAALFAAVYNGADAVYLGADCFNARRSAENFPREELQQYISFCRQHGVSVHAVLNTLVTDREMQAALDLAKVFIMCGADALIVQDLGLAAMLRKCTNIPLHASTQLTVHNLDGADFMHEIGFSRVVLSRELSAEDIAYITQRTDIETEVFVHGALCMSYSGQCMLSSVIGGRSGNRGCCAQPCRLPYEGGYRLSLKDQCLLKYVSQLSEIGVASLKIEGRMKGPDYVGAVCRAYADAKRGKPYEEAQEDLLADIFSRGGFTDGYFTNKLGDSMFGVRSENKKRYTFTKREYKRFQIQLKVEFQDSFATFTANTDDGLSFVEECKCEPAKRIPTDAEQLRAVFSRLGNTVYSLQEVLVVGEGYFIPVSMLNQIRRNMVNIFTQMRMLTKYTYKDEMYKIPKQTINRNKPMLQAQFLQLHAIPANVDLCSRIWLPVMESGTKAFIKIYEKYKDKCGIFLPPIVHDSDHAAFRHALLRARDIGIQHVLCGNIGQINHCAALGFAVCGDSGLNVFNTASAHFFTDEQRLKEITLSFELNLAQMQDISCRDCGIIAYGRLPVMVTRNCIKKQCHRQEGLKDRKGRNFLLSCDYNCTNRIWNCEKLYMADKDLSAFPFVRLLFTDESVQEAEKIINDYHWGAETVPDGITRGLYYRKLL